MSDQSGKSRGPVVGRRKLIVAAGLAAPMFFIRNGWAAGKSMYIGTYTGQQGEYIRRQVVPAFQSELDCKVLQTENVTLGNIGILPSPSRRSRSGTTKASPSRWRASPTCGATVFAVAI